MIRVIELFGGMGAVHTALDRLNIDYQLVDMVEFDNKVVEAYNLIHNTNFQPQDILSWNKDIKCDYLHASTPCQAFSIAGKQLGASDSRGAPFDSDSKFFNKEGQSPTLLSTGCDFKNKLVDMTTQPFTIKYRTLTPRECFRLMDFADEQFDKVKHFSTSRLTKLAGNSIVVECIRAILENIFTKLKIIV